MALFLAISFNVTAAFLPFCCNNMVYSQLGAINVGVDVHLWPQGHNCVNKIYLYWILTWNNCEIGHA